MSDPLDSVLREFSERLPADTSLALGFLSACMELQKQIEAAKSGDRAAGAERVAKLGTKLAEMARQLAPVGGDAIKHAGEHFSEMAAAAARALKKR